MSLPTNQIKEIVPGVFWVLLWCPQSELLRSLLDPKEPYVLCWDHYIGNYAWADFKLPIYDTVEPKRVLSRVANFDFIVETEEFTKLLSYLSPAIKAVQLSSLPPDFLDMKRIKGKQLYRLLNECGWHVMLNTPANDYGQVMSPKREIVEQAIRLVADE